MPSPPGVLPVGSAAGDQALSSFYMWQGTLPRTPGAMLRAEDLALQPQLSAAASAWRILYTTTDARWRSGILPASGTLHLPKGTPPQGGWPLVAWAHGTLGIADRCAPSWAGHAARDATYIGRWLQAGYAVVAADYQGLGGPGPHPYLVWEAEGRSVLDAVRAALAAHPGAIANDLVITGQSQGSGASLGASRIAPTYAPELNLRATIATGVVSSFPAGPVKLPQFTPTRGAPAHYTILTMIGGAIPDGGPPAESLLTEKGRRLLQVGREGCSPDMSALARREDIDVTNAFAVDIPKLLSILTPTTDMSPVKMPAPLFLGTGLADRTLSPMRQYAAAMALCSAGTPLVWKTYPGITHNGGVNAAFDDELAFVQAARAGQPMPSNCGALVQPGPPEAARAGVPFNE